LGNPGLGARLGALQLGLELLGLGEQVICRGLDEGQHLQSAERLLLHLLVELLCLNEKEINTNERN
jgi:hypothetical protein